MTTYNRSFIKDLVPHGIVGFKINQAISSTLNTVNGVSEIIMLNITLTNIQTGDQKVLTSYNLFVSEKPFSNFAQFLNEYLDKIDDNGFSSPTQLVGKTGKVEYFRNKKSYDDLRSWNFDIPSPIAQQQLAQHIQNNTFNQSNGFDRTDISSNSTPFHNGLYNHFESHGTSVNTDAPVIESAHFNSFKGEHQNDNY